MHVTMRSSLAVGPLSLFNHRTYIEQQLHRIGRKFGVKIYKHGLSGNHLHMTVLARTRKAFQDFLRVLTGTIARRVTGAQKGKPFGKRFWDLLAWSRIIEWGVDFRRAIEYVAMNQLEGLGVIAYQARGCRVRAP